MITIRRPLVPGARTEGSRDRPLNVNDHLFGPIIEEVHWVSGGIVVVELEFLQGISGLVVSVVNPENTFIPTDSRFTEIFPEDYRDDENWYAKKVGPVGLVQEGIITQDEINDIWIWDQYLIRGATDDPDSTARALEDLNNRFGQFKLHYEGMQVAWDTEHFGRPLLGDYITYTHPNGHKVTYAHGATPLSIGYIAWRSPVGNGEYNGVVIRPNDPNGFPEPPQNFSNTNSWYWYHLGTAPAAKVDKVRQAYLIYFKSDRTITAEIFNAFVNTLPEPQSYKLRGYPDGTAFDVSEGHINPKPGPDDVVIPPLWEVSESTPGTIEGRLKLFNAQGIIN